MPMRALPSAKSRLAAGVPAQLHADLVTAIRADTLAAVHGAATIARVVIIGDRPGPDVTLVQTTPGLNGALRDGAGYARARWPEDGIAALVGDLPALRAAELDEALEAAAAYAHAFVPDAPGTGTTLLAATPGAPLHPGFGPGSAARHGEHAQRLDAGPGLRHDVDTVEDLTAAADVGLGPATAALLGAHGGVRRSP